MHAIPKRPNAPADATINWKPFELHWDRVIVAIDPHAKCIEIDAAITTSIEDRFGGGWLIKYDPQTIRQVGIENLLVESLLAPDAQWKPHEISDAAKSSHEKSAIQICEDDRHIQCVLRFASGCRDCWCRRVDSAIFDRHTVVEQDAVRITIDRCVYGVPASPLTGAMRYGFTIAGQLSLVRYCTAYQARHAFAVDARSCGPNVFYRCQSFDEFGSSETHHRWGNGVLWDSHRGDVAVQNRQWMGSGHGHSGAYCVVWNCYGKVTVQSPPGGAWNVAVGWRGRMQQGRYAFPNRQTDGQGMIYADDNINCISSLYDYQCSARRQRESSSSSSKRHFSHLDRKISAPNHPTPNTTLSHQLDSPACFESLRDLPGV